MGLGLITLKDASISYLLSYQTLKRCQYLKFQFNFACQIINLINKMLITLRSINQVLYRFAQYSPASLFEERKLLYQSTSKLLAQTNFKQKILQNNPQLSPTQISVYCGYDPTAASLHLGNLVSIIMMARIQLLLGLRPIFVLGGATGQIGDPSGKKNERALLETDVISGNLTKIKNQINSVYQSIYQNMISNSAQYELQLTKQSASKAIFVNNYQFYEKMPVLHFLREVGKHISMSSLLSKEHIASRLESQSGISYTEFTYTILQAYDFYVLHKKYSCFLQFGGSDQWGNIVNGTTTIRKMNNNQQQGFGITMPLLLTKTGQKFGKSEGNALFIDNEMTPTSKIYDYLYSTPDQQIQKLLFIFTLYSPSKIKQIMLEHQKNKELRIAQKVLAESVTNYLGSYKNVKEQLLKFSEIQIQNLKLKEIEELFTNLADQMKFVLSRRICEDVKNLPDLLTKLKIVSTKKEGRRQIDGEGIYLNNKKIPKQYVSEQIERVLVNNLLYGEYLVVRRGKKKIFMLKFQNE